MHPLLGVWKLDETVRVVFEILLHTISTLWAEASFSLTLWSAKCSLDHYQYAISIFPEIFFWHLVINGQFMLIVQIPGLGRLWFDSLFQMSSLAIRDIVLCTLLFNLPWKLSTVFDRSIVTRRLSQVLTWVWPKSYTNCFSTIFSYIFVCFFPCISVVRCCCESSFMKITCHVTFVFRKA